MNEYHKIQSVFKRDPENNFKTFLAGQYTIPEFEYLTHNQWVFTEKVDGTNIRVMWDDDVVRFGGRTDKAQLPTVLFEALLEMFTYEKLAGTFDHGDVCLYGEGYGGKYREDQSFVLFDIKIGDIWLQRNDVIEIGEKLGVDVVPIVGAGNLHEAITMCRQGFISTWGDFEAEGIVLRPSTEMRTRLGHRMITKLKCCDFS